MDKPKEKKCKKCGITIFGLSEKDLDYKFVLHSIKHREDKDGTRSRK